VGRRATVQHLILGFSVHLLLIRSPWPAGGAPARTATPRAISRPLSSSRHRFKRQGYPLAAADAQCHDTTPDGVALHRMQQASRYVTSGRADCMPVREGAVLDVHDVRREAELAVNGYSNRGEGLVDLDTLHVVEVPALTLQRLTHRGHRPDTEHVGL